MCNVSRMYNVKPVLGLLLSIHLSMLLKSLSTITPGLNYFTVNGGLQTCSDYSLFGRTSDYHIYIWETANAVVFI